MTDKTTAKGDHQQRAKLAPDSAGAAHEKLDKAPGAGSEPAGGALVCRHGGQRSTALQLVGEARPILPSVGTIVQAGAFGAALGGMTTGVMEMARVQRGEISSDEAIRNVVKSSAQGAATMAVAAVAAQVVRSHPIFGFVALAAAGVGALAILSGASAGPAQAPRTANLPSKPAPGAKKANPA